MWIIWRKGMLPRSSGVRVCFLARFFVPWLNAGIVQRLGGIAQHSRREAQILGCSWANSLRESLRMSSLGKGTGQSTCGVVFFPCCLHSLGRTFS